MDTYILLGVFAFVILVFIAGLAYYKGWFDPWAETRQGPAPEQKTHKEETSKHGMRIRPSARYVPQAGPSTGQKRLFRTNKGMRSYYVNEQGLPVMPK